MATSTANRPAVNARPITVAAASPDPWYEDRPVYAVEVADLAFGARVRHRVIPGLWKVVRAAERFDVCRKYRVRVREQADNGSLVGPVLSWTLDEVAGLVAVEPAPVEVEAEAPVPIAPEADGPKPLVVAMVVTIDGTRYDVAPVAPGPPRRRAFRFVKLARVEAVYDVDESATGATCTCPDHVYRRAGVDSLGCRHVRAARLMGLIGEAPPPTPGPVVVGPRLVDDDGTELETSAEMDARHEAEHAAKVAELMEGNPFLPACCPADEPSPCTACATHEGPADLSDDGWDDSHVWATNDPVDARTFDPSLDAEDDDAPAGGPARSLAEQVDDHARELRALGSPLGDLLAERAESLAQQVRALDSTTVEQFRDRRDAHLDCAMRQAEARLMAAGCL